MTSLLLTCAQGGCGDLSGYLSALTHVGEDAVSLTPMPSAKSPLLPSVLTNDSLPPVSYRVLPLDLGHIWALVGGNMELCGAPLALDLCRAWRGPRVLAHALDVGNVCRAWLSGKPSQLASELEGVRARFEGEAGVQGRVLLMGSSALLSPVGDVGGDIEGVRRALRGAPELPFSTSLALKPSSHSSSSHPSITHGLGLSESQCSSLGVFYRLLALHLKASLIAIPGPGLDVTPTLDVLLLEGGGEGLIPPCHSPPEQTLIPWGSDSVEKALASLAPIDRVWGERVGASLSGSGEGSTTTTTTTALITTPPPCFVKAASALSPATCASLTRGSNAWALDCALLATTFMHNASKNGGGLSTEKWAESLVGGPSSGMDGEVGGGSTGDGVAQAQAQPVAAAAAALSQPPRASLRSSGGVGPRASLSRRSSFGVASEVGSAVSGGSSTASLSEPPLPKAVAAQPPPPASAPAPPPVKDPKAFFTSLAAGGKPPKKK